MSGSDLSHNPPGPASFPSGAMDAPGTRPSRRAFLGSGLSAAALATGAGLLPSLEASSSAVPGGNPEPRRVQALRLRQKAAMENFHAPTAPQAVNGDEQLYPDRIACFSKGLPHNAFGEVRTDAYSVLESACGEGDFDSFELVPAGETVPGLSRRLVNPLAGVAFDLEGRDAFAIGMRAPPSFASAEQASEIVEAYWMAILRDVPFRQYGSHPLAAAACADLSSMSDFRGPRSFGAVVPDLLFKEQLPGTLPGPLVSQFFWRPQPFGAQLIDARIRTGAPGVDHGTQAAEWLALQNGRVPSGVQSYDPALRFIRNGRDLASWVHVDVLYQAFLQAALLLTAPPSAGGLGIAPNPGNPYLQAQRQEGFATFGGAGLMALLAEVSTRALKAMWCQKWFYHRRLRPEAFAGRVHHRIVSGRAYPIHGDALGSQALAHVHSAHGTYLLPLAYPEGSPLHPSYGSGHATVAGACTTILKALLDTQVPFDAPVEASDDGLAVLAYTGADAGAMTVEGELHKLAHNVAFGRNMAGIHWRSDGLESLKLGEEVALGILRDQRGTYAEPFHGYSFRRFDGSTISV